MRLLRYARSDRRLRIMFSVIIPSYLSSKTIFSCLESIYGQNGKWIKEVIVVESSGDETAALIKKRFPKVIVLKFKKRISPGVARNKGAERARGKYFAFIDADCQIEQGWFKKAARALSNEYSFVGGAILNANPQSPISHADHLLTFAAFLPHRKKRSVEFIPSCHFGCQASAFRKIGGFPSKNFEACEDVVFFHKASQKFSILFDPTIKAYHVNRAQLPAFLKHHFVFGTYSAKARKAYPLRGSLLAEWPLLSPLAPLTRVALVSYRARAVSPLLLLGILSWGAGFVKTCWERPTSAKIGAYGSRFRDLLS
jgi:glycosyltransferase involved in cell wall biosynthesis